MNPWWKVLLLVVGLWLATVAGFATHAPVWLIVVVGLLLGLLLLGALVEAIQDR